MWRWIKRIVLLVVLLFVGLFFHYILPQHDVVRIVDTQVIRTDFTAWNRLFYAQADAGSADAETRDVRFINAVRPNDRVVVYRNEDTGWIWPPYFKFASGNLQAEAGDLGKNSSKENPQWVVVTHYGWRIPFLSVYPNAVKIKAVDSPDVTIIPWFNIIFFVFLAVVLFTLWRMIAQFRERTVDPFIDRVEDEAGEVSDKAKGVWGRFKGWLDTWKGKPRPPR